MYKHRLSKKEKHAIFYFLIASLFFFVALNISNCFFTKVCGVTFIEIMVRKSVEITLPNGSIKAEVADTSASREEGLSGRSGLRNGHGMLFVFDFPGRYGFWMKDMSFPIDMIWINENGVVVNVVENAKPEDYPMNYINQAPASYVLELEANKAREYGVYLGSKVKIEE